jgi:UDP-glucose 4-epimerase
VTKPIAVVTGGAGFIGSHLVDALLTKGWAVRAVDNLATGRKSNLAAALGSGHCNFVETDVNDHDALRQVCAGALSVFHFAALADIVPSIQNPLAYHRANVDGTASVLEAARAAGVRRFVYAASGSCYGTPDIYPTPETAPIRPQYPYALTKYIGEEYVLHWGQVYQMPVVTVRLLNVYGPRSRTSGAYGAVFGVFLAQKIAGRPLTIVGDGTQTRDFTFVSDAVAAILAVAESDVVGDFFNVGSGGTYSVNRLAELLGGPRVHIPTRPGEPDCTFADISKIRARLGWQPKVDFDTGVATMLRHLDYWRDAPVWTPETIAKETSDWFKYLGRT